MKSARLKQSVLATLINIFGEMQQKIYRKFKIFFTISQISDIKTNLTTLSLSKAE
jgi:hypothetical protein